MHVDANYSPVLLSYISALRGVKPRNPGEAFTYGVINCTAPELLIGLAASNPEGLFFGFVADKDLSAKAVQEAAVRQVTNVRFENATPQDILARLTTNPTSLPSWNYLVCDESEQALTSTARAAMFDIAAKAVLPGGLLANSYRVRTDADDTLRFLVREFAPEMNEKQASEFLVELKKLGHLFFQDHRDLAAKLDQAIARNVPDDFFSLFDSKEARSPAFDTIVALRPRGFTYAGDSQLPANYVELSVPAAAQNIVVSCRNNPLYEPIKDFVLNRTVRNDIWCRQPAATSENPAELYGGFAYGITKAADQIPPVFAMQGKSIDLETPIYAGLIKLMTLMPVGIGDILVHPDCSGFAVKDVVETIQVLVACGIARPMRGVRSHESEKVGSIAQPRLVGGFNQYLDKMSVTGQNFVFASLVLGDVVTVSARDALVMQALDRAGLANSPQALFEELKKLAENKLSVSNVINMEEPTAEVAQQMIQDAVSQSIVQWYAYGLLEAA